MELNNLKWAVRRNFSNLGLLSLAEKSQLLTQFLFGRLHEPDFSIFRLLNSDKPVLDIGANAGQSAISIHNANPKLKIISFEPNRLIVGGLKFTKTLLGPKLEFQSIGLGDKAQHLKMYVPVSAGVMLSQEGTFDRKLLTDDDLTKGRIQSATGSPEFDIVETDMQIQTLDSLNLDPSAIKIDVQGLELQVLNGGQKTLERCKPLIMVESVPQNEEIADYLATLGYGRFRYDSTNKKLVEKFDREIEHRQNWFYVHNLAKIQFV